MTLRKHEIVGGLLALGLLALGLFGGLRPAQAQDTSSQCIANALAGGTANAITIPQLACSTSTNFLLLTAATANTSANVTIQQLPGGGALPVVRTGGGALVPGDFMGAGFVALLTSTGSNWVLLNPAALVGGGTIQPGLGGNVGVYSGNGTTIGPLGNETSSQVLIGGTTPAWGAVTNTQLAAGAAATNGALPRVTNLAALKVYPTSYGPRVSRDDVAGTTYQYSSSACGLNGGNGDDGSQVKAVGSGCWLVDVPADGLDLRVWPVSLQTSTIVDYTVGINAALAWSAAASRPIKWPGGGYAYSGSGVTLPAGGIIRGAQNPSNGPVGSELRCANGAAICLSRGSSGAATSTSVEGLYIHALVGIGKGMRVLDSYDTADQNVKIEGFADCMYLAQDTVGGGGLGYRIFGLDTGNCSSHHLVVDGWPEARITSARFGMDGPGDAVGTDAFFYITGGYSNTAGGPNSLQCIQCQYNTGAANTAPHYLIHYANIPTNVDIGSMEFASGVVDSNAGGMTALVRVDNTVLSAVFQLNIHDMIFNSPGVKGLEYQATTQTVEWDWHDNKFVLLDAPAWSFPNVQHVDLHVHDNYFNMGTTCGNITINGASGAVGDFSHNIYDGACGIVLAGSWSRFTQNGVGVLLSFSGLTTSGQFVVNENTTTGETLASAATVTGGNFHLSYLTGAVTVTNFSPVWAGRVHYFLPTAGLTLNSGGAGSTKFCNAIVAAANQLVVGVYDPNNACWYVR